MWEKILNENEILRYEFSISQKYLDGMKVIWSILLVLLWIMFAFILAENGSPDFTNIWIILAPLPWIITFLVSRSHIYGLTTNRIVVTKGLLTKKTTSIEYDKITDISFEEPFLENLLFNTGHIKINSAGTSSHEIHLKHIDSPHQIKQEMDSISPQRP